MKNWKRLLALLLAGAMTLSLCACGFGAAAEDGDSTQKPTSEDSSGGFLDFFKGLFGSDSDSSDDADPSEEVSAGPSQDPGDAPTIQVDLSQGPLEFSAGVSPNDVLLTVNGVELPADLVLYILDMNCMNMQSYLYYFGMTLADVADTMLEESVSMAVYHSLIRQKAAELGCLLTDAQNAEIRTAMDEADLPSIAPYWGLTDESAEFIFAMNTYYANVLEAATHEPSAQELDEYLDSQGVFAVKHILLMTVDQTTQEALTDDEIAGKKALAEDLLAQLQAADDMPAKFDELMNEYSEDGGLATNPDGYMFDDNDSLVGGFREAALELEIGGLSGIVETDYGYHIMLRLPLTDEAKADYTQSFRVDALEALMAQWQEEAQITRSDVLTDLDVAGFCDRLNAYQQALAEQEEGEG